ncbi:MAG: deoxyribose-phosphate aldolase [Calditrichaeota bacterium]|nr:deoxyribose-phosphate aldolase [Calditrichota bacterium]
MKLILSFIFIFLSACTNSPDAQNIIDKVIERHGGDRYLHSIIEFDFRGIHFKVTRNMGFFKYERIYIKEDTAFHEVLDNDGLRRFANDVEYQMSSKEYSKYHEDVNSVVYFFLLPYALNDPAVMKRFLNTVEIGGSSYFQIEITFKKEGGGIDYEDRFIYYINRNDYTLDYFSYTDEKGNRFRQFKNRRTINGITFNDYDNYYEENQSHQLEEYYRLFNTKQLSLLSTIEMKNIEVNLVD